MQPTLLRQLPCLHEIRFRCADRIVRVGDLERRLRDTGGGPSVLIMLPENLGNADIFYLQLLSSCLPGAVHCNRLSGIADGCPGEWFGSLNRCFEHQATKVGGRRGWRKMPTEAALALTDLELPQWQVRRMRPDLRLPLVLPENAIAREVARAVAAITEQDLADGTSQI